MIRYIEGDIFKSPAQVIVNTVNTVGVMGKGIALEFKKRYPDMFQAYRDICDRRKLKTGSLMLYYEPDHWVLLFPTKENWRNPSRMEYIEAGLAKFCRTYAEKGIASVAFPKLGCGNGELNWSEVQPVMEKYLRDLPIDIYIYLGTGPDPIPEHKIQEKTVDWLRQNAKDMSFQGLEDDIRYNCSIIPFSFSSGGMDWNVIWQEGLLFENQGSDAVSVTVNEEEFFEEGPQSFQTVPVHLPEIRLPFVFSVQLNEHRISGRERKDSHTDLTESRKAHLCRFSFSDIHRIEQIKEGDSVINTPSIPYNKQMMIDHHQYGYSMQHHSIVLIK